jgi:hypothetical protein
MLPGAIQLEVVRRLNVVDGRDDAAHRRLVDRVLASSAPGRGQPDLELVGVHDGSPFGPRPVDPATLPTEELLRMAVGVLAELVLERDPGVRPEVRTLPAAPWRRGYHLAGDPQLARHAGEALADAGRRPGRRSPVAVLLADDLGVMLADVWTWRVQQGVTPTWRWWLAHWSVAAACTSSWGRRCPGTWSGSASIPRPTGSPPARPRWSARPTPCWRCSPRRSSTSASSTTCSSRRWPPSAVRRPPYRTDTGSGYAAGPTASSRS